MSGWLINLPFQSAPNCPHPGTPDHGTWACETLNAPINFPITERSSWKCESGTPRKSKRNIVTAETAMTSFFFSQGVSSDMWTWLRVRHLPTIRMHKRSISANASKIVLLQTCCGPSCLWYWGKGNTVSWRIRQLWPVVKYHSGQGDERSFHQSPRQQTYPWGNSHWGRKQLVVLEAQ